MCGLTQKGDSMKVFLRFYGDDKENLTVSCDWVSIAPDYISSFACVDDGVFPFTVRCYSHNDKDYLRIYSEVLDAEVI